jgi:hypothetical protein
MKYKWVAGILLAAAFRKQRKDQEAELQESAV